MAVLAETEGILSEPAGGVVVAGLRQLVAEGRIDRDESVVAGEEFLNAENRDAEEVYLGLRTLRGLAFTEDQLPTIQSWIGAGWAVVNDPLKWPRVQLTPTGWLRLDSLAADLAAKRTSPATATVGPTPSHCYI